MNWLDFVLICLVIAMMAVGLKRGVARAGFDTFTVLVARSVAPGFGHWLAQSIKFSADSNANEAYLFVIAFILVTAAFVAASIKFFGSSEYFDSALSGLFGAVTGLIVGSVLVKTISLAADPKAMPDAIALSTLGQQFVTFSWYRSTVDFLSHFSGS
jgi:uncharacterized membrane protein required for colicin V production